MLLQALCIIPQLSVNSNWSYSPETPKLGHNRHFFALCDLDIWQMTLKTIGHLFNATSSFVYHFTAVSEFKLELQSGNAQTRSKFVLFCPPVTLIFGKWPWKTIWHLFCATSIYVHCFVTIGEFKLESQTGNAQSGSKSGLFYPVWPWNLTDDLEKQ